MAAFTAVDDSSAYFKVQLYTGDGTAIGAGGKAVVFDDTDTNMQPDLVWVKDRDAANSHNLCDVVRGVTKNLYLDADAAEGTDTERLASFNSDGFTVGDNTSWNEDGHDYVAWCWRTQGGAGSSNTTGSINTTSTSVNTTSGLSISTYTGTGASATIGHGLGAVPKFLLIKLRDASDGDWVTWISPMVVDGRIYANSTAVKTSDTDFMDSTLPSSTIITLGSAGHVNGDGRAFVCYAAAAVQGFSKFGIYIGNGNADGPFVYTGFKPAFVIGTNTTNAGNHWFIVDNKRPGYNGGSNWIKGDLAAAELTNLVNPDFLSNGFKIRDSNAIYNTSGSEFVYAAFAETPLVNSNGVPCNAR